MKGFRVTIEEVKAEMESGNPIFFIDARNQPDWDASDIQVKGAVRIPDEELPQRLHEIPQDRTIITY